MWSSYYVMIKILSYIFGGLVIAALLALIISSGQTHALVTNIINTITSPKIINFVPSV